MQLLEWFRRIGESIAFKIYAHFVMKKILAEEGFYLFILIKE